MLKLHCRIKAIKSYQKLRTWNLASYMYTWPLFEVRFTPEVIPHQEHWKRVNKVES